MKTIYKPRYLFYNEKFSEGMGVLAEDGMVLQVMDFDVLRRENAEAKTEEWINLVMVPGTVNVHNHCFQSLLRGIACDRPFLEWRDQALYRFSPKFRREDIYNGAVFAFSEMMKCGVTCVSDFFYLHNYGTESDEMIVKAAKDVGIRLVLARTMYDWKGAPEGYVETVKEAVDNTKALARKYNNTDGMVQIVPAPHSLHAASPEMVIAGYELAKELNCCFHIHVAEEAFEVEQVRKEHNGKTPIEFLDELGVVDDNMVIIHGVWLKDGEINLLGSRKGRLAYCPSSNMFLADGITDIPGMMKSGVLIGLGSDGACSNNRISVFEEMRMAALLQKAKTCDSMCVNYRDTFRMGTENGGRLLDLPVGKIEAGYRADFVGVRINDLSMQPITESKEQILPNLVYSMQPTAIEKVVVNGKATVNDGKLQTLSEELVISKVAETMRVLKGE